MQEIVTSAPDHPRPTALLVEDHTDVRMLLRLLLEDAEVVVVGECASGEEAVASGLLEACTVVVVDADLPGMDGFELAARVPAGVAVVLCSGVVDADVRARADVAGIAACLSKDEFARLPDVVAQVARK